MYFLFYLLLIINNILYFFKIHLNKTKLTTNKTHFYNTIPLQKHVNKYLKYLYKYKCINYVFILFKQFLFINKYIETYK